MKELEELFPLIVPADYFQAGVWDLPHQPLRNRKLILTWVVLHEPEAMAYVKEEQVQQWMDRRISWQLTAIENMRKRTGKNPATHEKRDSSGKLLWVAMMQEDGLGSSRLLMDDELRALFPEGYRIALPERSVGMAISETADEQVNSEFVMVVRNCHRDGTTPMVDEILHPIDLMPDVKSN